MGREMQAWKIYVSWITSGILPGTLNHHQKNHLHQSRMGQEDVQHKNFVELHADFDIEEMCIISTTSIKTNAISILCWYGDPANQLLLCTINLDICYLDSHQKLGN